MSSFSSKEFKYENYSIEGLKDTLESLREKLRAMESDQFENSKLLKTFSEQLQSLKRYFHNQTVQSVSQQNSRYYSNVNQSKISANDTQNYSRLLERFNLNQQSRDEANGSCSLISMNFSDPSESVELAMLQGSGFNSKFNNGDSQQPFPPIE